MSDKESYKVAEFKLDRNGIGKILKSSEMMKALEQTASHVGDGKIETNFTGFDRCHVLVRDSNAN